MKPPFSYHMRKPLAQKQNFQKFRPYELDKPNDK